MSASTAERWPSRIASFDAVVERFAKEVLSFTEDNALRGTHWDLGEDARLREDFRFRPTPWGRWILSDRFLGNDALYQQLRRGEAPVVSLQQSLLALEKAVGRRCVFCPADPRMVAEDDNVRLASRELSNEPLLEATTNESEFVTHLPLYDLDVVAASMARGQWGRSGSERTERELGWLRVRVPERRLNERMFVARIRGDSMNDGKSALADGAYVVFERDPHGSRAGNVLVYSELLATGGRSWAVKKYDRDQRRAEGTHGWIRLVSLNPDKEQYPDIELRPEEDEQVQILAMVAGVLGPSDYARKPQPGRRVGRRDLTSPEARERIDRRLREAVERFFAERSVERTTAGDDAAPEVARTRFVCLDAEAGGLHIEAGPLLELPGFLKKLTVLSGEVSVTVLAGNLRNRVWRFPIEPSVAEYVWSAGASDELLGGEMQKLRLSGLPSDQATAFRVDAGGVGQLLASATLTPGQAYRLFLPPALVAREVPEAQTSAVANGWRLTELRLPTSPGVELRRALRELGLAVGTDAPSVSWVGVPPSRYPPSDRGETYPCFGLDSQPTLLIEGLRTSRDGELRVFLVGERQTSSLVLPPGERWIVGFDGIEAGRYLVEVVHERTAFESVRLAFAVDDTQPCSVRATISVEFNRKAHALCGVDHVTFEADFRVLARDPDKLNINTPPLWKVKSIWSGERASQLGAAYADRDGTLECGGITAAALGLFEREWLGDLILDFAELGIARLRHRILPEKRELRHELTQLAEGRSSSASALCGQFPALRSIWLEPILQRLGYSVRDVAPADLEQVPPATTAILLDAVDRKGEAIVRRCERVMVVFGPGADPNATGGGSVREYARGLCAKYGTEEAILTDGILWIRHIVRRQLQATPRNLPELLALGGEEAFEDFLLTFSSEAVQWS